MKAFYITTPLYYVNAKAHIGHSYTNIASDTIARFHRIKGEDVFLMTGTDEHGLKVEEASLKAGFKEGEEKKFVDGMVKSFKDLWKRLFIEYDFFIRTTDDFHKTAVKKALDLLYKKGDIYKDKYDGWYCTPCENFWAKNQLTEPICPDCKRPIEMISESNYFFKLSKYQKWLISYIESHPDFIMPKSRRNEVLGFLKNPLNDLCISRPRRRLKWGIDMPFDKDYVVYVWFDALLNYISGPGYAKDEKKFKRTWPADFQLIGKDILRHHAVYWPIMLHAMGLEPPRTVFAHGWWTIGGEKMSKSKGNIVDPFEMIDKYGVDAYRYFLLREMPFGADGTFSEKAFVTRFNSDLANDLGNLLNRTLTMVDKYFGGEVPNPPKKMSDSKLENLSAELKEAAAGLWARMDTSMQTLAFCGCLTSVWEILNRANKYIEEVKPWVLSKEGKKGDLENVIYNLVETQRITTASLWPFMPGTCETIWNRLGLKGKPSDTKCKDISVWGKTKPGAKVNKGAPLFPRIVD